MSICNMHEQLEVCYRLSVPLSSSCSTSNCVLSLIWSNIRSTCVLTLVTISHSNTCVLTLIRTTTSIYVLELITLTSISSCILTPFKINVTSILYLHLNHNHYFKNMCTYLCYNQHYKYFYLIRISITSTCALTLIWTTITRYVYNLIISKRYKYLHTQSDPNQKVLAHVYSIWS